MSEQPNATGGVDLRDVPLPASTPTRLTPPAPQAPAPEPLPEFRPGHDAGPDAEERAALARKMIETNRKMGGDPEFEARVLADLAQRGFELGPDPRSPALQKWDKEHAALGLAPARDAKDYDMQSALRALPPDTSEERRAAIGGGVARALQILGLPARLGSHIAEVGIREGLRLAREQSANPSRATEHADAVRGRITGLGRDFDQVKESVNAALAALKAQAPDLHALLSSGDLAEFLAHAEVLIHIADSWERAKQRRGLS